MIDANCLVGSEIMLEVGKYYKGSTKGNSYKCLDIQDNLFTMWVLVEVTLEPTVFLKRSDGKYEPFRTLNAIITQDIAYQDRYEPVTDSKEIMRLSQIYHRNNPSKERNYSQIVPFVKYTFTESEFNTAMDEIDSELREQKVPIPNRPLNAPCFITQKLNVDNFIVLGDNSTPGEYTSHNLGSHINQWYKVRYGDKLKKDFRLGRMIVEIQGEYYTVGFPLLFGRANFICDTTMREYSSIGVNEPAFVNLLTIIEGLTKAIAEKLTEQELKNLCTIYGSTYNAIINYEEVNLPYKIEALTDLETAVDSFFYTRRQYGQSKWHSLQFAEKLLKGVISSSGKSYPFTHKLEDLSKIINTTSGIQIDNEILKKIDCKPEVRYSSNIVSEEDAFRAHSASLALLQTVINQLPNTRNFLGVKKQ